MRITAISAILQQYQPRGRPAAPRQTITIPLAPSIEATPADLARLAGRGILVDVLC